MAFSGVNASQAGNWSHLYDVPAAPTPADAGEAGDAVSVSNQKLAKPIDLRPLAMRAATRRIARLEKHQIADETIPLPVPRPAFETAVAQTSPGPVSEAAAVKPVEAKLAQSKPAEKTQSTDKIAAVVKAAGPLNPNIPMYDLIAKHAQANGVPVKLAAAVIEIESRYQAKVVHAGNYGLMQIRAQTARGMGFLGPVAALTDPETNLRFGMKYLGQAYRLAKGDLCSTVMRYQSGFSTTHLNAANRAYCAKAHLIMAHS